MSSVGNKRKKYNLGNIFNDPFLDDTDDYNGNGTGSIGLKNLGSGPHIYDGIDSIKSIKGVGGTVITEGEDTLTVNSVAISSIGTGVSVYNGSGGVRSILAGANTAVTLSGDDIVVSTSATPSSLNYFYCNLLGPTPAGVVGVTGVGTCYGCEWLSTYRQVQSSGSNISIDATTNHIRLAPGHTFRITFDAGCYTPYYNSQTRNTFAICQRDDVTSSSFYIVGQAYQCMYAPGDTGVNNASGGPLVVIVITDTVGKIITAANIQRVYDDLTHLPFFGKNDDFSYASTSIRIEQMD